MASTTCAPTTTSSLLTPPALSYTTINALLASNGIIMAANSYRRARWTSLLQLSFGPCFLIWATQLLTNRGHDKQFDSATGARSLCPRSGPGYGSTARRVCGRVVQRP